MSKFSSVPPSEWQRVQRIERRYHERKDPRTVLALKRRYWRRLLDALPAEHVVYGPRTRILDAGCGGTGILLELEDGVRTGIDPLMSLYLERFPFLAAAPIRWVEGRVEDLEPDEKFDLVFSINMLDHTADPAVAASHLVQLLAPQGRLVLTVNVHLTRFWRRYFERFYRFIDPPHPHHIHIADVRGLFPSLRLLHRADLDALWLDLRDQYDRSVCNRRRRGPAELLASLLNPFKYPIAAAELFFERPFHRRSAEDEPIMAKTLFIFGKPDKPGIDQAANQP